MFQEAVELLLLFVGQPHTGGHLISCTEVVTPSLLATWVSDRVCVRDKKVNARKNSLYMFIVTLGRPSERHVFAYQSPGRRCERRSCSGCCRCC